MACVALSSSRFERFEERLAREQEQDDFSVDRLIASCKPTARPPLPSAGRQLVPYFALGSEESSIHSLSDMGARTRKNKVSNSKTSGRVPGLQRTFVEQRSIQSAGKPAQSVGKQAAPRKIRDSCKVSSVPKLASSQSVPNVTPTVAVNKSWAGPSFYNSPAPESLPLPTAYLLAV